MSVTRDAHGIPHVHGGNVLDLAFQQGRACAEDRRWQLEIERLRGEGRTAELVGAGGVEWDTLARRVRLRETAQQAFASASSDTQEFVTAYVDGVRSGLPTTPCAELERLGQPPGEWEPWTPMAIWLVQHVMFGSFGHHLWRRRVGRVLPDAASIFWAGGEPLSGGSNAFVIGGDLTASGLPIVAGDPHRIFEAPNVYAQVRLSCPEFDVIGLTFPGVPGVQHFGHTGDVAWAVTNAMADQQALVEVPLERCVEGSDRIVVRDAEPVDIRTWGSAAGPGVLLDGDSVLCMAGPSYAAGSMLDGVLPLLRARSVADVDSAMECWVEPANNVLIADRAGRTLHRVAGQVVAPLPRIEGSPDGVLVSGNDQVSPAFAVLGDRFAPPYRADRMRALLAEPRRWTVADAAAVLTDVRLDHTDLIDRLATLSTDTMSDLARDRRARLLAWDRELAAGSRDAALYVAVRDALVAAIATHEALADLADPTTHGPLWSPWLWLPGRIASTLAIWLGCDRPLGIGIDALLIASLEVAQADRTWGELHRFRPVHALDDLGLAHDFDPRVAGSALSGDSDCVAATGSLPGLTDSVMGPAARYVWDLADRDASRWAVPLGAAGDPRSPHHCDQFGAWVTGVLIPVHDQQEESRMSITFRPVDPDRDAELIHRWVTQPRAAFWGMLGEDLDGVRTIYSYIDEQPHLSATLASIDGSPVAIVQTYDPFVDEIGDFYDRRPGDLGAHLFLADDAARAGRTPELLAAAMARVFADPAVQRVVLEPDADNDASLALLGRLGVTWGPVVDLPTKKAQFAFVERRDVSDAGERRC